MTAPAPPAKPYGHGPRCTRAEREARLAVVEEMMFRRLMSMGVIERTLAPTFGVGERSIRRYIKTVKDRARARATVDPDPRITRELLTEAIVDRYNSCVTKGDERTALRALNALADLHGLRVTKHEISGPNGIPLAVSAETAAAELAAAIDRAAARHGGDGSDQG